MYPQYWVPLIVLIIAQTVSNFNYQLWAESHCWCFGCAGKSITIQTIDRSLILCNFLVTSNHYFVIPWHCNCVCLIDWISCVYQFVIEMLERCFGLCCCKTGHKWYCVIIIICYIPIFVDFALGRLKETKLVVSLK